MAIECYYHWCPNHGTNETPPDEGPFCHLTECIASDGELEKFQRLRKRELDAGRKILTVSKKHLPVD
jgi:hypothetical protein